MTDNQLTKAYNDQNVYILGAGFSAEAGLPLIKDFMNRMRDAAAWASNRLRRRLSSSSAFSRRASDTSSPPYFAFHL